MNDSPGEIVYGFPGPIPCKKGIFTKDIIEAEPFNDLLMVFLQKSIRLSAKSRGFHLITSEIVNSFGEIRQVRSGMLQIFILHTSASLTLNENADPSVRLDMESHFNHMVPERQPYYTHTYEGDDDMPAHIKASLLGSSLLIPITNGRLNLGTWQGIYLCEHRDHSGSRKLVLSAWGN